MMLENPSPRDPARWPVRVFHLGDEPRDDMTATSTAEERIALVWTLSERAWELTGRGDVRLRRADLPVRILRAG